MSAILGRQISPQGQINLRMNAEHARAEKRAKRDRLLAEPIEADFTAVLDWAEPRGILFKEWNDIPRVNAIRERLNLLPFKRQFPTKGRFG